MIYWIAYSFLKLLSLIFYPLEVSGREYLPGKGGFILASNHISNMDPFIVGLATKRKLSYMAKDSLFKNKILRVLLKKVEAFPVKRETPDFGALKQTLIRLKGGWPVVLFPEGTRKKSVAKQEIQSGVGFVAVKSAVPVVPVFIEDSDKVLPPGRKILRRHRVKVRFGKPLIFQKGQSYPEVAGQIMKEISALSQEK